MVEIFRCPSLDLNGVGRVGAGRDRDTGIGLRRRDSRREEIADIERADIGVVEVAAGEHAIGLVERARDHRLRVGPGLARGARGVAGLRQGGPGQRQNDEPEQRHGDGRQSRRHADQPGPASSQRRAAPPGFHMTLPSTPPPDFLTGRYFSFFSFCARQTNNHGRSDSVNLDSITSNKY
ncbi:MAG: hypothetical protein R3D25_18565 [Geminicoccaceae bacterium]